MVSATDRIALFIDGHSLQATAKALGFDIDYKRLLTEFQGRGSLLRAFYYTVILENQEYQSIRPLTDWLDYNGFTVVKKATKEYVDQNGQRKLKGNIEVELAVDAMELAPRVDQVVLFSGDGNFWRLIQVLQQCGVRVTVVSALSAQHSAVSADLRRQADEFIDLNELRSKITRDTSGPRLRPQPRADAGDAD